MAQKSADSRFADSVFVESILCATDFSSDSMNAFAHALMIAMNLRCEFTLLHAGKSSGSELEWSNVPGVRDLLERWGYLEKGSPRSAVSERLAVDVKKVYAKTGNVLRALLDYLEAYPTDLVVMGTDGPSGAASWFRASAPEKVIRNSRTMTLVVPATSKGFVSPATGGFTLKRVLVPVVSWPDPHRAITYAFRTAVFSSEDVVHVSLLHVRAGASAVPKIKVPERPYLKWEMLTRTGRVAEEILKTAEALDCDLIVMATESEGGFRGALRGSVTQQIVRSSRCPVLAVPVSA
jgi:nucleotide-binding universal stress UspA family protein